MFSADMARTRLRLVSFKTQGMTVDRLRFGPIALWWHARHMLGCLPRLLLHNLPDEFIQRTLLEPAVSAGLPYVTKDVSNKGCITPNRLSHRHFESPKHERYEARNDQV